LRLYAFSSILPAKFSVTYFLPQIIFPVEMNIEQFREYCLTKPGTSDDMPFGPETLVLRVGAKMFALCDIEHFESINLKSDPAKALDLREQYPGITPGYHMNKKHWNTVMMDGSVNEKLVREMIDMSYELVKASLPKTEREKLG